MLAPFLSGAWHAAILAHRKRDERALALGNAACLFALAGDSKRAITFVTAAQRG